MFISGCRPWLKNVACLNSLLAGNDNATKQEYCLLKGDFRAFPVPFPTMKIGSLSTHVFETRTATGSEHFAFQDSGVSQIFILIISNGEKILSNVNVVV